MLLPNQRRQKILELIQEEGAARVSGLSKVFGVSEPTVRQDLERLESDGLIAREHGGAFLTSIPEQVARLALHRTENMDKKAQIGQRAAEFVNDGESVILDSGTTATEMAKNLLSKRNIRVITDSINIALLLGAHAQFEVLLTGGLFKAPTLSVTGEKATAFFDHVHVDKLFLATGGISIEAGLTYPGFSDLAVKGAMMDVASEVYVVADSTKVGKVSFAALGRLDSVDYLITDNGVPADARAQFEGRGITVVVA